MESHLQTYIALLESSGHLKTMSILFFNHSFGFRIFLLKASSSCCYNIKLIPQMLKLKRILYFYSRSGKFSTAGN